ncbi:MAG: DNA-directed RNA polymerase subunit omega [Siphonobacter sp.]
MAANPSIVTRDTDKLAAKTNGNIYEAVAIMAARAKQLSVKQKEELNQKLSEFASTVDNLEEIFENREQIEISKHYERQPKPASLSVEEFIDEKVQWRYRSEQSGEE